MLPHLSVLKINCTKSIILKQNGIIVSDLLFGATTCTNNKQKTVLTMLTFEGMVGWKVQYGKKCCTGAY